MGWQPGSRWDHGSSRRPYGTHGGLRPGSIPAEDQRAQGTPAPPVTPPAWPRALPAGATAQACRSLRAGPSGVGAGAGAPGRWDQHAQEGGLGFPGAGPAWQSQRPCAPGCGQVRRPRGLGQDLASDSATVSPPRRLQVLSCTPERKLYPSWNTDQRTCGTKAAHLMACLQRLHCFLLTPCDRAQRSVGILFEKNLLSSK